MRPVGPRELYPPPDLATLRAAGLRSSVTQGIGLRPQPWAMISRPVGPACWRLQKPEHQLIEQHWPQSNAQLITLLTVPSEKLLVKRSRRTLMLVEKRMLSGMKPV